jgi:hypothetical protein
MAIEIQPNVTTEASRWFYLYDVQQDEAAVARLEEQNACG